MFSTDGLRIKVEITNRCKSKHRKIRILDFSLFWSTNRDILWISNRFTFFITRVCKLDRINQKESMNRCSLWFSEINQIIFENFWLVERHVMHALWKLKISYVYVCVLFFTQFLFILFIISCSKRWWLRKQSESLLVCKSFCIIESFLA